MIALTAFLLTVGIVWVLVKPFFENAQAPAAGAHDRSTTEEQRSRVEQVMADLELDQSTGKLEQPDFEKMKRGLEAELNRLPSRK